EEAYSLVEKEFPRQVEEAHRMVVSYLRQYDPKRLRIFQGEVADPEHESDTLHSAHSLIASMLHEVEMGNPTATPVIIDRFARLYLRLPYQVIEGGAANTGKPLQD